MKGCIIFKISENIGVTNVGEKFEPPIDCKEMTRGYNSFLIALSEFEKMDNIYDVNCPLCNMCKIKMHFQVLNGGHLHQWVWCPECKLILNFTRIDAKFPKLIESSLARDGNGMYRLKKSN